MWNHGRKDAERRSGLAGRAHTCSEEGGPLTTTERAVRTMPCLLSHSVWRILQRYRNPNAARSMDGFGTQDFRTNLRAVSSTMPRAPEIVSKMHPQNHTNWGGKRAWCFQRTGAVDLVDVGSVVFATHQSLRPHLRHDAAGAQPYHHRRGPRTVTRRVHRTCRILPVELASRSCPQ